MTSAAPTVTILAPGISPIGARDSSPDRRVLPWPAWSMYLAISWTWCIGMFLPVLLIRDFGWWGYFAFLLPNCIGSALMGRVLTAETSRDIFAHHGTMIRLFSLVTAGFQAFFMGWIASGAGFGPFAGGVLAIAISVPAALLPFVRTVLAKVVIALCTLTFIASILLVGGSLLIEGQPQIAQIAKAAPLTGQLLWLMPVCVFGFALCPYLDGTFHTALRASAPKQGRAFGVGFMVLFAVMALLTPLYAGWLSNANFGLMLVVWPVALHMLLQTSLTIFLHGQALSSDASLAAGQSPAPRQAARSNLQSLPLAGVVAAAAILGAAAPEIPDYAGLTGPELVYRAFLVFYGLVFPAYVWICIIPFRGKRPALRRGVAIWIGAVVLALPCFWVGFIERQTWWLAVGLGVMALAKCLPSGSSLRVFRAASLVRRAAFTKPAGRR